MAIKLTDFNDLPGPLRIGIAVASAGGLLGVVWVMTNALPTGTRGAAVLGITLGILAIALVAALYIKAVKWRKARQAKPMEQQVLRNAGTGRQGISDPEQLARIDDLRKKFEEGIATFRSAGKSLYSLPWYVILGESGSGKTEAIRHCGIGFPPNLHDRYQGVGGTRNMNWWFTDYGVIVDTAGRLMFEEAGSGGTREWKEFLSLLAKFRPTCPINGVLLVIPSTSLIRDSVEEIEKKAAQIAQQFDVIQRTLDVRFPVYVVVTKSDLINGFREFFDGVSDPHLQHQILGWSNSQELDKPYNSDFVDKYLEEMQTRLFRMRLTRVGELLGQDAKDEEKPATDALYAFPYAFEQLGPRLKRYLDLIFCVGSQWSCKPLFFRGIYFTSSMQEGAALDEDLAAALGVPVDSLPTGPVWRRDRAYFLRDLFTDKVFREWGLVTRATNARKLYMRRRAVVLGCIAATLLVLTVLTVYGRWQFGRTVGKLVTVLKPAAQDSDSLLLIGPPGPGGYPYRGDEEAYKGVSLCQYYEDLAAQADNWRQSTGIPRVFRPAVRWRLDENLQNAAAKVYVAGVLEPLVSAAAEKMSDPKRAVWTVATARDDEWALYYLARLRAGHSFPASLSESCLGFLMEYVPLYDPEKIHEKHKAALADPLVTLCGEEQPPYQHFDDAGETALDTAIDGGIKSFNAYWGNLGELKAIADIVRCLTGEDLAGGAENPDNFAKLEQQFIDDCAKVDPNIGAWERLNKDCDRLAAAKADVDEVARDGLVRTGSLREAWESDRDYSDRLKVSYDRLMAVLRDPKPPNSKIDAWCTTLEAGRTRADRLRDPNFKEQLGRVDRQFWVGRLYEARFTMYKAAADGLRALRNERTPANLDALRNALESLREGENRPYDESHRVREGRQAVRRAVLSWWLAEMPANEDGLRQYIRRSSPSNDPYDPNIMTVVFSLWNSVKKDCPDAQRAKEYGSYACAYIDDCLSRRGPALLKAEVHKAEDWVRHREQIESVSNDPDATYKKLVVVQKRIQGFLTPFDGYACDGDARPQCKASWDVWDVAQSVRCQRILRNWARLRPEALQSARQSLLEITPDRFLGDYFMSPSPPRVASPDCYWRHLALTSLELFADAVIADVEAKAREVAAWDKKFPLNRNGTDDLTVEDVGRLHEISRQLLHSGYAQGAIGTGAGTNQEDVDTLLDRLRKPVVPASLAQDVNVLPLPDGKYWCKVVDTIRTEPRNVIRKIVIRKGQDRIECLNNAGVSWVISDKPLAYDCSKDDKIEMEFFQLPSDDKPVEIREPRPFPAPWPWHRMLKDAKYDERTDAYVFECVVTTQKREKVNVELRLRFFKELDRPEKSFKVFGSAP